MYTIDLLHAHKKDVILLCQSVTNDVAQNIAYHCRRVVIAQLSLYMFILKNLRMADDGLEG